VARVIRWFRQLVDEPHDVSLETLQSRQAALAERPSWSEVSEPRPIVGVRERPLALRSGQPTG